MNAYERLHKKYLLDAKKLLKRRDYPQASEKFWGATAELVKAIAESRGWRHHSHRDLLMAMSRLADETGDRDLDLLFSRAQAMHANFHEDFMTPQRARAHADDVKHLIEKLGCLNGRARK